ncbi:hypothetical protein, partial [Hymenobacter caeli]|uniref:hypothetical protein n=1 Tax=Hymenobacter caeli TaxID=2735894 RepID=UPI0036D2A17C
MVKFLVFGKACRIQNIALISSRHLELFKYYSGVSSFCKLPFKVSQSKIEVRQLVETRWGLR